MPDAAESPPEDIARAADRVGVTHLLSSYADAVTRRDRAALERLFLADCEIALDLVTRPSLRIVGPRAMADFVLAAIERFAFFEFVVLNSHVEVWPTGDRSAATGRVFMCELRQLHGETERTDAFGRYDDTYAKVDGRWMFAARAYRSMARWPEGVVFPTSEGDQQA